MFRVISAGCNMALDIQSKRQIRINLLLELNNCFSTVSKHFSVHGSYAEREFLQTLIGSIKECIDVAAHCTEEPS